jgi:hypothetical protein
VTAPTAPHRSREATAAVPSTTILAENVSAATGQVDHSREIFRNDC